LLGLEELFAVGDDLVSFASGHGEDSLGADGKFLVDEVVGGGELGLPLFGAEGAPGLHGDPLGASEIGRGGDAFDLDELGVVLGGRGEGDDLTVTDVLEVEESEHLAADGLVADPEDEVVAPLHGLDCMREGKDVGADTFGVDGGFSLPGGTPSPSFEQKPLFAVVYGWSMPPNSCKQMGYG
jgi:hypothetical protein